MLHGGAVSVHGYHMNMKMVHGRMGMYAAHDLLCPIPPGRKRIFPLFRIDAIHGLLSRALLFRNLAMSATQFVGSQSMELGDLRTDFDQKFLVLKGFEWMEEEPRWVAWEEQKMEGGFGVFVMDSYKVGIVVDNDGRREGFGMLDIFA